ncbi:hypothetical protein LIER_18419 [Lithospermum erythrorhizon]|uniref:Uncharacterized protein n=1 Tax=Lithospermum erythrorhizon TaxID=34254 RepID=A0AAV3QGH5_LITER
MSDSTHSCPEGQGAPAPRPVVVSSSSEEDESLSSLLRRDLPFPRLTFFVEPFVASILIWAASHRPRPHTGETSAPNFQDAALESSGKGTNTPPSPEGHFSSKPPLLGQNQNPLSSTPQVPHSALVDTGEQHSTTVILGPEAQGGAGLAVPQTPSSVPFSVPESQPMK